MIIEVKWSLVSWERKKNHCRVVSARRDLTVLYGTSANSLIVLRDRSILARIFILLTLGGQSANVHLHIMKSYTEHVKLQSYMTETSTSVKNC